MRYPKIFISFRVFEARSHAIALKRALAARGLDSFCSETDISKGNDWVRTICEAEDECKLVVVLASKTYGATGTDAFGTEKLAFALREKKELYVVPLPDKLEDAKAKMLLGSRQHGQKWIDASDTTSLNALVDDICALASDLGISGTTIVHVEAKATPSYAPEVTAAMNKYIVATTVIEKDNAAKDLFRAVGNSIPSLVDMIGPSHYANIQKLTAYALQIQTREADNQVKVAAAGAIPPLVALLGSYNPAGVQEQAAGVLWHLSVNADNKVKVAAAGAIPPLVALLGSSNPAAVQEVAKGALTMLGAMPS